MSNSAKWILAFIILSGLVVRLLGIQWGLPSKTLSLTSYHPDEPFVFQSLENIYTTRSLNPKKIALHYGTFYFYLSGFLLLVAKLLGFVTIGSRQFLMENLSQADRMYLILRFFSVLCGIASVYGTYLIARRLYEEKVALWSSFFIAFSPIAIASSHYAKLDSLLLVLIVIFLYHNINFIEEPSNKNAWICGIFSGLLAGTRYNSGIFILVPFSIIWHHRKTVPLSQARTIIAGAFLTFLVTTPYAILDFSTFLSGLEHMWTHMSSSSVSSSSVASRFYGFFDIPFNLVPFGTSWIILVLFLLGCTFIIRKGWNPKEKVLFIAFVSFFILICSAVVRFTLYIIPLLPIISILASVGLETVRSRVNRQLSFLLLGGIIFFQVAYGWSFVQLYSKPNPRELAGEWLLKNVSSKDAVGIIRSYFWTPGILRQKNSPYLLLKGGDDQADFTSSVFGLEKFNPLPSYFVMSDLEMRNISIYSQQSPKCMEVFQNFISHYERVTGFELEPKFMKVSFWIRTPPWDLKTIAPTLWIYRKK